MEDKPQLDPMFALGIGLALGGGALWLAFQAWPVLLIGAGVGLMAKGAKQKSNTGGN